MLSASFLAAKTYTINYPREESAMNGAFLHVATNHIPVIIMGAAPPHAVTDATPMLGAAHK